MTELAPRHVDDGRCKRSFVWYARWTLCRPAISLFVIVGATDKRAPGCEFALNTGSDSLLVVLGLNATDDAGLKKIEVSTAIHLAFDELEFGDLPLGLAVRPG